MKTKPIFFWGCPPTLQLTFLINFEREDRLVSYCYKTNYLMSPLASINYCELSTDQLQHSRQETFDGGIASQGSQGRESKQ